MGSAGKDDLQMHQALLAEIIREAAEPHSNRGVAIETKISDGHKGGIDEPYIIRRPEIIHGLRNMIQNAVDFATSKVWVESSWTKESIKITISDDGYGYPPNLLGRLGDPFLGTKIGKENLAQKLLSEINGKLESLSEDPAIEGVHFTAFAIR